MARVRRLAVVVGATLALALSGIPAAHAAAPTKDGWWNETNVGLGFSAVPAQVPAGGLYVENGFSGPTAISALVIDVPSGTTAGQLTLDVTGQPVITSPPVACPLTSAGLGFKPVQGGPWTDRPAYDCSTQQVTATVASNHSTVTFDVAGLEHDGVVGLAIKAGGAADQITFDPPGPNTLAVVSPAAAAPGSPTTGAFVPPSPSPAPAPTPSTVPTAPGPTGTEVPAPAGVAVPAAAATAVPPAPGPVTSPLEPAASPTSAAAPHPVLSAASASSTGSRVAEILGVAGLIGLLVAYTEGYGLLGGRIRFRGSSQAGRSRPA